MGTSVPGPSFMGVEVRRSSTAGGGDGTDTSGFGLSSSVSDVAVGGSEARLWVDSSKS